MRSVILSQWRERRKGVMGQDLGALKQCEQESSGFAGDGIIET